MTNGPSLDTANARAALDRAKSNNTGDETVIDDATHKPQLFRHTVCFNSIDHALLMAKINAAGNPQISAYLRSAALDYPIARSARRPTTNHEDVARLIGQLGDVATAFRQATGSDAAGVIAAQDLETAMHDLSELRLLCFKALGRRP